MKSISIFFLLFPFYLLAQAPVEPVVQFGHLGSEIAEMLLTPDGTVMATTDGQILKFWDMQTGLEIRSVAEDQLNSGILTGPRALFERLHFSFNGEEIVYLSSGRAIVRSVETGKILQKFECKSENQQSEIDDNDNDDDAQQKIEGMRKADFYHALAVHPTQSTIALLRRNIVEIRSTSTSKLLDTYVIADEKDTIRIPFYGNGEDLIYTQDAILMLNGKRVTDKGPIEVNQPAPNPTVNIPVDTTRQEFRSSGDYYSPSGKYFIVTGSIGERLDSVQSRVSRQSGYPTADKPASTTADSGDAAQGEKNIDFNKLFQSIKVLLEYNKTFQKEGVVYFCDPRTGEIQNTIHTKGINRSLISPDSKIIAISNYGENIGIIDADSAKLKSNIVLEKLAKTEVPIFGEFPPNVNLMFTKDSRSLVIAAKFLDAENLSIWDTETGKKIMPLGANIPLVNMDISAVRDKQVELREFVKFTNSSLFFMPVEYEIDRGFRSLNLSNGKVPASFPLFDSVFFSPKKDYYAIKKPNDMIKVFYTAINEKKPVLQESSGAWKNICFSNNAAYVAASDSSKITVWETQTGNIVTSIAKHKKPVVYLTFDPEDRYLISAGDDDRVGFWAVQNDWEEDGRIGASFDGKSVDDVYNDIKAVKEKTDVISKIPEIPGLGGLGRGLGRGRDALKKGQETVNTTEKITRNINKVNKALRFDGAYDVTFTEDGKRAAIWGNNYYVVKIYDFEKKKVIETIRDRSLMLFQELLFGGKEKDKQLSPADSGYYFYAMYNNITRHFNLRNISALSPDYSRIAISKNTMLNKKKGIKIECAVKKVEGVKCKDDLWLPESEGYVEGLSFSPDGRFVAASSRSSDTIKIWDATTGNLVKSIGGHSGKLTFGPKGETLFSSGWDRQIKAIDLKTGNTLYSFVGIKGTNDYLIILPDGHYTASRRDSRAVAFSKGKKAYPFEQFDLKFNRPDILLEKFGETYQSIPGINPNTTLIQAYKRAFEKRIEHLGFRADTLSGETHLPEVTLGQLPLSTTSKVCNLSIEAKDDSFLLDRLHIYVNDVPLYGAKGIDLRGNKMLKKQQYPIELSNGENKIQVSVINNQGVESLYQTANVVYNGPAGKSNTYLILAGSSQFTNPDFNLEYPIKDLEAVKKLFTEKYPSVIPVTLYDQDFTREKFLQIKNKIKDAKTDDKIIVMVNTHGAMDENHDYFLATYDMDFNNAKGKGLPYSDLESIFDETKARNRLVLIDACNAGEIDKKEIDDLMRLSTLPDAHLKIKKQFSNSEFNHIGYQESFELMKDLFIDLRRNSGATIIASARNAEFALEGSQYTGGVFTSALLQGLTSGAADLNKKDGKVTISELQEYLSRKVAYETLNQQRPVHRVENIGNDWQIW